jgi:hypothetical protein
VDGADVEHLDVEGEEPPARPRRTGSRKLAAIAATVAGALVLGGIGVAVAADNGPSSTTTPPSTGGTQNPAKPNDGRGPGRGLRGLGGPGGFGMGMGGVLHGEFVTPNGSGGYRTVDTQVGEVKDVSKSSITVQSKDGFKKSYDVTENTVVDSGRDGIGTVKTGDTVRVTGVVNGSKTEASSIDDETTLGSIRHHWNPEAPMPGSNGTGTTGGGQTSA